jgi:hypothetical protein
VAQAKGKSAKYYAANPTAAAKKAAYQRKLNKKPAVKNASEERWSERRRRGIAGKGGDDLSHTKGGKMVLESPQSGTVLVMVTMVGVPENEQRKR